MATMMDQLPQRQPKFRPNSRRSSVACASDDNRSFYAPLVTFLLISLVASVSQQVKFLALVPESFRPFLGDPPSAALVSLALAIYFVSMLVIIAHGICSGGQPGSLWFHVGCRSTFYLLYFIGDGLAGNLVAVLLAGSILLGLEYHWLRLHQRRASWGRG
ncbi:MAG: hypothetical protein ACYDAI_04105 [Trichloromonadaceae bacterium]